MTARGSRLPIVLRADVATALSQGHPVVALESTIVSHGMPYPENVAMARSVEAIVRAEGAVPATIAVLDGTIRVGLGEDEMEGFARAEGVAKASSRDLAAVMVRKGSAGTTVSATMRVAALAGIRVFATGGIGGVHRGAEESFDISADLAELGATGVAVVCAGGKSILDIPKTLEYLETMRVPVIAYGTDAFPAFFTRDSYFATPAFPLESVFDPTGAGDSFAGGFMGYLAQCGKIDETALRQAVIYGSVMASFNVEEFSCDRLRRLQPAEIRERFRQFKEFTHFEI